ncbi:MAG: GNAT family N-acetyltransferase [Candidatus Heimdallarchaeota archaeon]|nr:GNAT family N-acetyltransferase [Candidatus Heimdallarchaeota archaeon]
MPSSYSFAGREEIGDIVELNKKLVPEWYHYTKKAERGNKTNWGTLSSRERFIHGGPWLSKDTLKVHLDNFTVFGEILLLWLDGELIGELEFHEINRPHKEYISDLGTEHRVFHLDWMMIDPHHQQMGWGRNLLNQLEDVLKSRHRDKIVILTEPEAGVTDFYQKCGYVNGPNNIHVYSANGTLDENRWIAYHPPEMFEFLYGNFDVSPEYSLFQMSSEIHFSQLFGSEYPIAWMDENNVRVIKQKSSVLHNQYRILLSSSTLLEKRSIQKIINKLPDRTLEENQLRISLPYLIESKKWKLIEIIPKLIKVL